LKSKKLKGFFFSVTVAESALGIIFEFGSLSVFLVDFTGVLKYSPLPFLLEFKSPCINFMEYFSSIVALESAHCDILYVLNYYFPWESSGIIMIPTTSDFLLGPFMFRVKEN
jgi:hypothetical protein